MPWQLDTSHSSVEFAVKHMVVATTRGRFHNFEVDADIDENNLPGSSAVVRIDAASLDSRDEKRDEHLRSADFFDVANHPKITFATTKIEPKGSNYRITGDLTIRGVTREVVLDGEVSGPVKDPWGNEKLGISASGKVNRKEFGLVWNMALEAGGVLVSDDVKMSIEAELTKAA